MAQAPDAGGRGPGAGASAPRINETVKQFSGMNTREGRNAVPKGAFPWLENIQPIAPGNLHSIPGRGQSLSRVPPIPVPPVCTDATLRGQTHLSEELRFINNDDLGGNTRTSWAYISPAEVVTTLAGAAGCAGGNMIYTALCCQLNHFVGPGVPFDHPALVPPLDGGLPFINTNLGVADESAYMCANSPRIYFPDQNLSVFLDDGGGSTWRSSTFAKRTNEVFIFNLNFGSGDPDFRIAHFNAVTGAILAPFSFALTLQEVSNATATANFVYAMIRQRSDNSIKAIAKIDKTLLTVTDTFDLTNIGAKVLFCVSDNLIYILTDTNGFYYVENFTDIIYVGSFSSAIGPFAATGFFTNGAFYYGANGFGGFSPHIYRIVLPCPEGAPIIASVETDPTVVHGADLTVDWADVLEPTAGDVLYLNPNDGVLFHPTPLATQIPNLGTPSGTWEFPIPGGTTPGSYVIQYVWSNTNLVATSAPFTVT